VSSPKWAQLGAGKLIAGFELYMNGTGYYRAGQLATAQKRFEASLRTTWTHGHFLDWYYLALCHHHLGNHTQARQYLDMANRHMDNLTATVGGEGVALYESDWAEAPLLRQEVEKTLDTLGGQKKTGQ
jgi:hypothetical protein